jgi:hypothetical protein
MRPPSHHREGAPLVGKSSVLRELAERTAGKTDLVVFFIDAEAGGSMFQAIADVLGSALSWPVTRDEARDWVSRLSNATDPALVQAGIVEPITWSLFCYLSAGGADATAWIEEAARRKSLPLLARVEIALFQVARTADPQVAPWARQTLENVVKPALSPDLLHEH